MPRKAKETLENMEKVEKMETAKKATKKVASSSTAKTASRAKKVSKEETAEKKTTKKAASASTTKTASKAKKVVKEETAEKSTKKKTTTSTTKKTAAKATKQTASKTTKTKKTSAKSVKKAAPIVEVPEYYDLPYHYNQTVVKILAQTPTTLFVYWDVSEEDRKSYEKQFGPDFFNNTLPCLRVKNETRHTSFDVEVDDFANGWYLQVEDAKCDYSIELFRKQRPYTAKVVENPVYITSSNQLETPNDHILFDSNRHTIYFRNVKSNQVTSKRIAELSFLRKIGNIYNIYDFYKQIYQKEDLGEVFDLNNPTSGNPTSTF